MHKLFSCSSHFPRGLVSDAGKYILLESALCGLIRTAQTSCKTKLAHVTPQQGPHTAMRIYWPTLLYGFLLNSQEKGVKIIAVGVGVNIKVEELKTIAMGKDENVIKVHDFDKLFYQLQDIIDSSCQSKCKWHFKG